MSRIVCILSSFFVITLLGTPLQAGLEDLVISEIYAFADEDVLVDEDGDSAEFAEVFNSGATSVDLGGCFFTDDPFDLLKWQFPSVTLAPGEFLVLYGTDKDRRDPLGNLHLNFKFSALGEFLALVAPDGGTLLWEYSPYPEQVEGFSYGLSMNGSQLELVLDGANCRARVPTSSAANTDGSGRDWREIDFDDSSWMPGTTGVGYDEASTYNSLINLDVEAQMNDQELGCYVRIPFTVPPGESVSGFVLRMKYDDGFIAYINGTRMGSKNAPAVGSWNSGATGQHDDSLAVVFEDIAQEGAPTVQTGTNILAIHGLNDNLGSSDFVVLPELDGFSVGELDPAVRHYFPTPTPGFSNLQGFPDVAEKPAILPATSVFTGTLNVTLSTDDASTDIRYTTNGTEPTASSTLYNGTAIAINRSTLVRARGFKSGLAPSAIASRGYMRVDTGVLNFNSDLPVVIVETFTTSEIPSSGWQSCFMALWEPGVDGRTRLTDPPTLTTRGGIRRRGSSSGGRSKASFAFESWNEQDEDVNIRPLGMAPEADWIFYGAFNFDRARMRNPLIYDLSNQMGTYATRSKFVEMFVHSRNGNVPTWNGTVNYNGGSSGDGMGNYMGVYSFMEKIERDANRVNVTKLTAVQNSLPEVSGGYMVKVDRADPGDSGFSAGGQGSIRWVYPKEENVTNAQSLWLQGYLNTMANNLSGSNYGAYIDVHAWIDHHILNVLANNVDALRLSAYMYKDRNGLFAYGPIWDFDRSMGSTDGRDDNPRMLFGTGDSSRFFSDSRFPWWERLFGPVQASGCRSRIPGISGSSGRIAGSRRVKDRCRHRTSTTRSKASKTSFVKASSATIDVGTDSEYQYGDQRAEELVGQRVDYIDDQFVTPPSFNQNGGPISAGFNLTMTAPSGTIYYELDGSDPRGSSGNARGTQYSGAITLNENARVVARSESPRRLGALRASRRLSSRRRNLLSQS